MVQKMLIVEMDNVHPDDPPTTKRIGEDGGEVLDSPDKALPNLQVAKHDTKPKIYSSPKQLNISESRPTQKLSQKSSNSPSSKKTSA